MADKSKSGIIERHQRFQRAEPTGGCASVLGDKIFQWQRIHVHMRQNRVQVTMEAHHRKAFASERMFRELGR